MIGRRLGHYRILEKLGTGGMGEVYRARDEQLDRDVALKILLSSDAADPAARARLLHEARIASQLNHPHICIVYEVGEAEGQAYISMELVEGRPLDSLVAGAPQAVENIIRYGAQIADALAHAHDQGIIHRDLKSANVVIARDARAKVLDFGLARRLPAELPEATESRVSLQENGSIAGTFHYLAPELLRGEPADTRSDIWALGVLLYEAAAGHLPFNGKTLFELSSAILYELPSLLPARIPTGLRAVIVRCMAKEPRQRYQHAGEVRAALEALQPEAALVLAAPPVRRSRRMLLKVRNNLRDQRKGLVILSVSGITGGVLGGVLGHLLGGSSEPSLRRLISLPYLLFALTTLLAFAALVTYWMKRWSSFLVYPEKIRVQG